MSDKPTPEQIDKLPKFAQSYIRDLIRERETAIKALNDWTDTQTPQSFFIEEMICTGEEAGPSIKRRYIEGHRMAVVHKGVRLTICLRDKEIDLQWEDERRSMKEVAMIPRSYQQVFLTSAENMMGIKTPSPITGDGAGEKGEK